MTNKPDPKHHWIVVFRKGTKPYLYLFRTVADMTVVVKSSYDRSGSYPHGIWAIVDDEMRKVDIT